MPMYFGYVMRGHTVLVPQKLFEERMGVHTLGILNYLRVRRIQDAVRNNDSSRSSLSAGGPLLQQNN